MPAQSPDLPPRTSPSPRGPMTRSWTFVLALLVLASADLAAQRRQLSLEFNPVHGTLGYGWALTPTRSAGLELGIGFPQLDRTLAPADESFLNVAHVGAFLRSSPSNSITLDGRVQIGMAELEGCSGCLPGTFAGVSAGAFFGGKHLKVGPRLTAGVINELDESDFVLNVTPVAALFTYSW